MTKGPRHEIRHASRDHPGRSPGRDRSAHPRVEGPLKTTGTATYAAEHHDLGGDIAYGYILGAAIGKGRIAASTRAAADAAPGVRAIVTYRTPGRSASANSMSSEMLAGPESIIIIRPSPL